MRYIKKPTVNVDWQKIASSISVQSIGLVALGLVALAVSWSSIDSIKKNQKLQNEVDRIDNIIQELQVKVKARKLKNQYYASPEYQEIAARKYFGKAAPNEKLLVISDEVAKKYVKQEAVPEEEIRLPDSRPKVVQNLNAWLDFFLHRQKK